MEMYGLIRDERLRITDVGPDMLRVDRVSVATRQLVQVQLYRR
jgi:hypothetical protein